VVRAQTGTLALARQRARRAARLVAKQVYVAVRDIWWQKFPKFVGHTEPNSSNH
jgi:hypothetical protein